MGDATGNTLGGGRPGRRGGARRGVRLVLGLLLAWLLACACSSGGGGGGGDEGPGAPDPPAGVRNVVLVIVDDVGAEFFDVYETQPGNPPTPNVEALAAQGVLFRNAWATPVCSPFRASAFTGRNPGEHGVGGGINPNDPNRDFVLDPGAPNLANLLSTAGYRTAAVGKWHMAFELGFTGGDFFDGVVSVTEGHPNLSGMDYYAGHLGGGLLYFDWMKTTNGVNVRTSDYATSDTADEALAQLAGSEPFFLWLAFNAPHGVIHEPPHELLADPSGYDFSSQNDMYAAMIEAMDSELGRVLDAIDLSTTTVVFVADNGTQQGLVVPPRTMAHAKATPYQAGVHVPLIVAGEAVAASARGRESDALVQATDLFPTVLEIAGLSPPARDDAVSLLPYLADPATASRRDTVYTEMFEPNGGPIDPATHNRAARGPRYKLVRIGDAPDELYDLDADPFELSPLDWTRSPRRRAPPTRS